MFALLKLVPIRDWIGAGVLMALFIGVLVWNHYERDVGEQECQAAQIATQAAAQAAIDANAAEANAKLKAKYDASIYQPINYKPATDCGSVPADVLMRINAAGKAGKH